MLVILKGGLNDEREEERNWEWHLGEPLSNFAQVVTFQADGDELRLFIEAMQAAAGSHPSLEYSKRSGFVVKEPR